MTDQVIVYGIKNCDTIKKARKWLDTQSIDYRFHDYRTDGLDQQLLSNWVDQLGWEALLNKRGTTWRKLPDTIKENIDQKSAIQLMLENSAIIKRPLLVRGEDLVLGFDESRYLETFA
ncbi:MAG: arsenate reductase [Gammaproteobacteria bacterium]|jgi:arsenate reductase